MKHINTTLKYLFSIEKGKRYLCLFVMILPLSFLFACEVPMGNFINWIKTFTIGGDFKSVFLIFVEFKWKTYLLIIVLGVFGLSIISTIISRSLRVGKFYIDNIIRETNESFFPAVYICAIALGMYLMLKILNTSFLYLWQLIPSQILALLLTIIFLSLTFIVFLIIVAMLLLCLPIMVFKGVRPYTAVGESIQKTSREFFKLLGAVVLPTLLALFLGVMFSLIGNRLLSIIIDTIVYGTTAIYYVTLSFVSFYNVENLPRVDIPRSYYYKK